MANFLLLAFIPLKPRQSQNSIYEVLFGVSMTRSHNVFQNRHTWK